MESLACGKGRVEPRDLAPASKPHAQPGADGACIGAALGAMAMHDVRLERGQMRGDFRERGEVGAFFRDGHATYGGDIVINPHGGLLSEGYIHGLNHHYESTLQLRGDAGVRQVDGAEVALVTAGGGPYGGANVYSTVKP